MIQLRKLRRYANSGTEGNSQLSPPVSFIDHADMLSKLDETVKKLHPDEQWNCYYTLGETTGDKKLDWQRQDVIAFDIDKIVDEKGEFDEQAYIDAIFTVLGVDPAKCLVVASGNGLQILVRIKNKITDKTFFAKQKDAYLSLCKAIADELTARGLKFSEVDPSSFAPNRIFRLPGTVNRKPGLTDRIARALYKNIEPQEFPICPPAEKDKVKAAEQVAEISYDVDSSAVEKGCEFLKWAWNKPEELQEPQWYAMLSVVGKLEDGEALAHKYSEGHPNYSKLDTDKKLQQALAASGPRTCENIDSHWGRCKTCPNFGKVTSPIQIHSEDFIPSEKHGFYITTKKGNIPQYADLIKFFNRKNPYVSNIESGVVYVWNGTHYVEWPKNKLRGFAHDHWKPMPIEKDVKEFHSIFSRSNQKDDRWFRETGKGLLNMKNGVLDLATGQLLPHCQSRGFMYVLPYEYNHSTKSPVFDRFIEDVTCGDKELERMLLEFLGYAICSFEYWVEKAPILLGGGSNGKSTFLKVAAKLVGEENVSHLSMTGLNEEKSRWQLEGKLINISDELPTYSMKNSEMLKRLFGGTVSTRRLYHDQANMTNRTKLMFAGNELPDSFDTSEGWFRRFTIIPFKAKFDLEVGKSEKRADPQLIEKMTEELPGILNRVLESYADLRKRGSYEEAQSTKVENKVYRRAVDKVGTWIKDTLYWNGCWDETAPESNLSDVYARYTSDCQRDGLKPVTKPQFGVHLRRLLDHYDERHVNIMRNRERLIILRGVEFRKEISEDLM